MGGEKQKCHTKTVIAATLIMLFLSLQQLVCRVQCDESDETYQVVYHEYDQNDDSTEELDNNGRLSDTDEFTYKKLVQCTSDYSGVLETCRKKGASSQSCVNSIKLKVPQECDCVLDKLQDPLYNKVWEEITSAGLLNKSTCLDARLNRVIDLSLKLRSAGSSCFAIVSLFKEACKTDSRLCYEAVSQSTYQKCFYRVRKGFQEDVALTDRLRQIHELRSKSP